MKTTDRLLLFGYIYDVYAGFQFDLNSILKKTYEGLSEGHLCDHNCTSECGNYDCPAAFTRNKDIIGKSMITFSDIKKSLVVAKLGLAKMNRSFLKDSFPQHVRDFHIPSEIADYIKNNLEKAGVELNLFGGNPELHPHFIETIRQAKQMGWKVTATTTGKKFLSDEIFPEAFLQVVPDLLAISADDYESVDELIRLAHMSLDTLKKYWQKANPLYGQRKKAYESVYVAKFAQKNGYFCPILFNIVVHPGNISYIDALFSTLHKNFPESMINPYPAQSSFSFGSIAWKEKDTVLLEKFIDSMIRRQIAQADTKRKVFVPRLAYWLALKSIFCTVRKPKELIKFMTGYGTWTCFRNNGAGRYLQATSASVTHAKKFKSGGHPGCFWNNTTVTNKKEHIWDLKSVDICTHLLKGKTESAQKENNRCPGCLMPRLMFDGLTIESGLNPMFLPAYLTLRKKYFDF